MKGFDVKLNIIPPKMSAKKAPGEGRLKLSVCGQTYCCVV